MYCSIMSGQCLVYIMPNFNGVKKYILCSGIVYNARNSAGIYNKINNQTAFVLFSINVNLFVLQIAIYNTVTIIF